MWVPPHNRRAGVRESVANISHLIFILKSCMQVNEQMSLLLLTTFVLGARPAIKAAAALPALFSSMKLMVELMMSNTTIPTKSCQSGGLPYFIYLQFIC